MGRGVGDGGGVDGPAGGGVVGADGAGVVVVARGATVAVFAASEVVSVARYVSGLVPTFSASPRASNVASALPTAPDECPSVRAITPGVTAAVGSLASCSATLRRSSPLRNRVLAPPGVAVDGAGVPVAGVAGGVVMAKASFPNNGAGMSAVVAADFA